MTPFTDPVWLAEVRAWIESQVEVEGEIEQPYLSPWSTALRVPTREGPMWFKASRDEFAFEAALLDVLVPLAPQLVTQVIASRPEAGWLLMADAGERAREHPIDWAPLVRAYAELQIAAIDDADTLLAVGTFDLRSERLPSLVQDLFPCLRPETAERLRAGLPRIHELFERLTSSPLPATVEHGDLHDANVFVRDGHVRILDWGDANVAHPLLSLTVEMEPSARPAYLQAWTAFAPLTQLEREAALVEELRYLLRAINWLKVVPYDRERTIAGIDDRVNWFFDGVPGDGT
jgi:aminoglycoside phosphotransferase (APT) family kinase protein